MNDLEQIVGFRLLNGTQQAYLLNPEVNTAPQVSRIRVQALLGETVGLKFVRTHTDVDGDTPSISRVFSPERGALRRSRVGRYQYVPSAGYTVQDRITDVISDNRLARAKGMVRVDVEAPRQFSLEGNASNPFRDQTTIVFTPPDAGHVRLDVFDVLGRRVAQLVNQELAAGCV